jgi:hypothetical protein
MSGLLNCGRMAETHWRQHCPRMVHQLTRQDHIDAPWRPADIEQCEGWILRQGNQNAFVHVNRYVTATSCVPE